MRPIVVGRISREQAEALRRLGFSVLDGSVEPERLKGSFVLVVGDEALAKRLGVAHMSVEELEAFLKFAESEPPA
ncbi:hypothetical protein TUZN_1260 [Thermoproteus uzoniensis 768-20]|uniref:Uncharacterized protein n=1 Tax=Thermoproteus uzoniensis (strain 768-20) TaxID=999630 RepID=F2L0S1_THEU7|nr:hypothetical protein [Thermoproteus uzoniensis]AEA12736.1 hypothetical protein TUZN_1260 [Thermoproteus uzoniensis 768-20]